VTSCTEKIINI